MKTPSADQHAPDLFKILRVLVDRPGVPARFLVLASASPALLQQSSESMAGRIEVIDGPQSVVWDEAENRMHVQKALMEYLLLGRIG